MLHKYATLKVLGARMGAIPAVAGDSFRKSAKRWTPIYEPRPGMLYVRSRAISSRTNDNYDTFPAAEIAKAYRTFVGKPVFVNHHNADHRRARGVIIDAVLHEDLAPDGSEDTWVEVLMEVDAVNFPKLAKAILKGKIDRTSMGTSVGVSECSYCGNRATSVVEFCKHIPAMKGRRITRTDPETGRRESVLVSEICYDLTFFENSLLVEDPADPTAVAWIDSDHTGMMATATKKTAARDEAWLAGFTWEVLGPSGPWVEGGVRGTHPDGGWGFLTWHSDGEIRYVEVGEEYRRRGLASELFRRAKEIKPDLHHSNQLNEHSRPWAATTASVTQAAAWPEMTHEAAGRRFRVREMYDSWVEDAEAWADHLDSRTASVGIDRQDPALLEVEWTVLADQPGQHAFRLGERARAILAEHGYERASDVDVRADLNLPYGGHTGLNQRMADYLVPEIVLSRLACNTVGMLHELAHVLDVGYPWIPRGEAHGASWRATYARLLRAEGLAGVEPLLAALEGRTASLGRTAARTAWPEMPHEAAPEWVVEESFDGFMVRDGVDEQTHRVQCVNPGYAVALGGLEWYASDGQIANVWVDPEYRRQGIATALLAYAREIDPRVHHSTDLSQDGEAWARAVAHTASVVPYPGETIYRGLALPWSVIEHQMGMTLEEFEDADPAEVATALIEEFDGTGAGRHWSTVYNVSYGFANENAAHMDALPVVLEGTYEEGMAIEDDEVLLEEWNVYTDPRNAEKEVTLHEDEAVTVRKVYWGTPSGRWVEAAPKAWSRMVSVAKVHVPDDPSRYGDTSIRYELGGQAVLDPQDLPPVLYHVTTAGSRIGSVLHADHGKGGGLGGNTGEERSVSFTVDRKIASDIASGMAALATAARAYKDGKDLIDVLEDMAVDEGWVWDEGERMRGHSDFSGATNSWFFARQRIAGIRNPLFFGVDVDRWASIRPSDIGVVTASREDVIASGAMVTDFDLGAGYGLEEVRVWGDVRVGGFTSFASVQTQRRPAPVQAGVFYHVTSYANWRSIRANGLYANREGLVWLFTNTDQALRYSDSWANPEREPCIVVVRTERAVPIEGGIPGAYVVKGDLTKDEVYEVIRPGEFHYYSSLSTTAADYWMSHRPGADGPPLHDLLQGDMAPRDIYENPHYYTGGYGGASREAIRVIHEVRGRPDAMVTIYRSLPPNAPQEINPGDWISLSRAYAELHGQDRGWEEWVEPKVPGVYEVGEGWVTHEGDWPVISRQVPAWQVRWDVNDLCEMGWFPNVPRTASKTATRMLDLYHRTTPEAAAAILEQSRMTSRENTQEAYFSTVRDGEGVGYGTAVVHVRVPEHLAEIDDEFPSGEQHYRVKVSDLKPEHFVREGSLGQRTAMSVQVEKTGLDEVDEIVGTLVRDFLAENPDVNDYRVPENAHGYCEIVADRFTEFCTARGYRAHTEADYTDVWGYEPKGPARGDVLDEDGNIVTGYYDEHAATSIYGLPGRHLPVSVDFTAAQYGYTEFFPYVHGSLGKSASLGYYFNEHADQRALGQDHDLTRPRTAATLQRFAQEVLDRESGFLKAKVSLIEGDWSETYPPEADGTVVINISRQPQNRTRWTVLHEVAHALGYERGLDAFDQDHGPGFRAIFYGELLPQYGVDLPHRAASLHTAMASTTGIPEIDALIEDFKRQPLDPREWGPGGLVTEMSDPYNAHGYCQTMSEQFVEFARARGFDASTNDMYMDEIGYTPSGGPYGEVLDENGDIVQGYYPEHTVAVITVDDGSTWGRDIYIDFTAAQYGYSDFPKVTGSAHTASPARGEKLPWKATFRYSNGFKGTRSSREPMRPATLPLTALRTTHDAMTEVLSSGRASSTPGPIWVNAVEGHPDLWEIADGHHRVAEAIRAGRTEIEALVDPVPDDEPYEPPFYDFSAHMGVQAVGSADWPPAIHLAVMDLEADLEGFISANDHGSGCDDIARAVERDFGVPQVWGYVEHRGRREPHSWNEQGGVILDAARYVFDGEGADLMVGTRAEEPVLASYDAGDTEYLKWGSLHTAVSEWKRTPGGQSYRTSLVGKNGKTYYITGSFESFSAFTEEFSERLGEWIKVPVGRMHLWDFPGHWEIHQVSVNAEHRRQGIASAMLDLAREFHPDVVHSGPGALSDDGAAWAAAYASLRTASAEREIVVSPDSTHALAGQTVDCVPIPEGWFR